MIYKQNDQKITDFGIFEVTPDFLSTQRALWLVTTELIKLVQYI